MHTNTRVIWFYLKRSFNLCTHTNPNLSNTHLKGKREHIKSIKKETKHIIMADQVGNAGRIYVTIIKRGLYLNNSM